MVVLLFLIGVAIAVATILCYNYSDRLFETGSEKVFIAVSTAAVGALLFAMSKTFFPRYVGILFMLNTAILGFYYIGNRGMGGDVEFRPIYLIYYTIALVLVCSFCLQDVQREQELENVTVETTRYDLWSNGTTNDPITCVTEKNAGSSYYEFYYFSENGPEKLVFPVKYTSVNSGCDDDYLLVIKTTHYKDVVNNGRTEKVVAWVNTQYQMYLRPITCANITVIRPY